MLNEVATAVPIILGKSTTDRIILGLFYDSRFGVLGRHVRNYERSGTQYTKYNISNIISNPHPQFGATFLAFYLFLDTPVYCILTILLGGGSLE